MNNEKIQSWIDQILKVGQKETFIYLQRECPQAIGYFMLAVKQIEMGHIHESPKPFVDNKD